MRGAPRTALALYIDLKRRADRRGHVRISNDQLARAIGVKDRHTVCSAAHLLVDVGLIDLPVRTYDRQGYVDGLDYALRFDPDYYGAKVRQRDLPLLKSSKSSAPSAPPSRPPELATMGHVQKAAYAVTDPLRTNGQEVPETRQDRAAAVRIWLTEYGMTATDATIDAAIEHVEQQRRRQQQPLPLVGVVARGERRQGAPQSRQAARRTTIRGASDLSNAAAWSLHYASASVSTEERDRRRAAAEQLRADVAAAVEAQPPDAAAALRDAVRPAVDDHLRRCPGLTDRDRPRLERDAIVVAVLQQLGGKTIAETIAALIADVRRCPASAPVEAAPDVAAHLADLRRRVAG
jgi:hypothetical protein